MHKTEGTNHSSNTFIEGPLGTTVGSAWLNAVQNEIVNTVEEAGITLKTATTETGTQLKEAVNTLQVRQNKGYVDRSILTYVSDEEVILYGAGYYHEGTTNQIVYWDTGIAFDCVTKFGGALGNDTWYYFYLDDSAIVAAGTNLITLDEVLISTTAPSWSPSKRGHYNGNDKCINAVLTDGAGDILPFSQSNNRIFYHDAINSLVATAVSTSWTTGTCDAPGFCTEVLVQFGMTYVDGPATGFWRTYGLGATSGLAYGTVAVAGTRSVSVDTVICDSSQRVQIKHSAANNSVSGFDTNGFVLPKGM